MRQFFNESHPWIMQAVGGVIAVIAIIPVAVIVYINVINSKAPETAVTPLAPPAAAEPTQGTQNAQTPQAGTQGGQASGGKTYTVKMQPGSTPGTFVFNPANLTIHAGDTVHWIDVNQIPHDVVGTGAASGVINRPAVTTAPYSATFTKAGTYHYECTIHLPSMVGVITVVGTSKPPSSGNGPQSGGGAVAATWSAVHAVFAKNCVGCHVGGATLAGLSLDTYAGAMKGGSTAAGGVVNGAVIKPGDAAGSYLYQAITGKQKVGAQMPLARPPLSASDIQLIYNWIQGGAKQ